MDVRLIAHRGYAIHAPQNSAEAFEAAGRLGFWAIETDVRRTLDGVLVCCHDATVDSMFCGSGEISALPWDALRSLTFREDKKNGSLREEGMPLFRTYLSICKAHGAVPFIELKTMDTEAVLAGDIEGADADDGPFALYQVKMTGPGKIELWSQYQSPSVRDYHGSENVRFALPGGCYLQNCAEGVSIGGIKFDDKFTEFYPLFNADIIPCRKHNYRLIYEYIDL